MADKIERKGVKIFIDGKEVENSLKEIRAELSHAVNAQAKAAQGTEKWIQEGKKVAQLKVLLREHVEEQKRIEAEYNKMSKSGTDFIDNIKKALPGLIANLATLGIHKLGSIIKTGLTNAFNTIKDFEQANANLATVLGTSRKEITALTDNAKNLGATTEWTAAKVTELQTELAKLGFSKTEILNATKPILGFATALQAELGEAAEVAGAALRAFGLDAVETERVVGVMTVAANKSALSFEYIKTALATVAPVAKAFGFTIEDTMALLGTLSDAGFDASTAATSTRNILLNLADSSGKLAKALGTPVKSMNDLVPALIKLRDSGVDLNTTLELTDKRSVAAFNRFLDGAENIAKLRGELENTEGELDRIRQEQLNTTEGSIKMLNSAWEGLILSFSNSAGVFKNVIDWLTDLVTWMNKAITAYSDLQKTQTETSYYKQAIEDSRKDHEEFFTKSFTDKITKGYTPEKVYEIEKAQSTKFLKELEEDFEDFQTRRQQSINMGIKKKGEWSKADTDYYNNTKMKIDSTKVSLEALDDVYKKFKTPETVKKTNVSNTPDDKAIKEAEKLANKREALLDRLNKVYDEFDVKAAEREQSELLRIQQKYDNEKKELDKGLRDKMLIQKEYDDAVRKLEEKRDTALNKIRLENQQKQQEALDKWNEEETQAIIKAAKDEIEERELAEVMAATDRRLRGITSEIEYKEELLEIEKTFLEKKMRVNGATEKEIMEMRKRMADINMQKMSETAKRRIKIANFAGEQINTITDAVSRYFLAAQEAEIAKVNKKYDTQIKAIDKELAKSKLSTKQKEKLEQQKASLEDQRDEEARKIKAKYQEKSFQIQIAQALAGTAQSAIAAYASASAIPVAGVALGPIAAATATAAGLLQVAAIKKQADAAKAEYYAGGFTPSGNWDKPQGVVHSDEFVANRFATANSTLRPVFDMVDYAQRNNTLNSLTKDDVARALRIPGYAAGGYVGTDTRNVSSAAPQPADLSGIYSMMDVLFEKLDNSLSNIRVINSVTGRDGMKEALDRYDVIIKNKSR